MIVQSNLSRASLPRPSPQELGETNLKFNLFEFIILNDNKVFLTNSQIVFFSNMLQIKEQLCQLYTYDIQQLVLVYNQQVLNDDMTLVNFLDQLAGKSGNKRKKSD
jgi:hypothetical protein